MSTIIKPTPNLQSHLITTSPTSQESEIDFDKEAKQNYLKVEKKFKNVTGTLAGASAIGLLLGSLRYGLTFPSQVLKVIGDLFGSISSVAAPFFFIGNEIINYKIRSSQNGKKSKLSEIKETFDALREGFYRCSSLGFTPFIFEPFINPEKVGKSIFHKIATLANIPNLIFTGYMWGIGNFKALIAWGLRTKEQLKASKTDGKQQEESKRKINSYNNLYQTFWRQAVIGSIANPTMQGLRQCADSLALFTGKISAGEFFERPFLGLSRLVSLFAGVPEFYAKGIDSILRVVKERENLKTGLPKIFHKPLEKLGEIYKENIACEKNTPLKSIAYYAEVIFHTLSPLSMFALFAPLLDESHLDKEAQNKGGLQATLDRAIGRAGKGLTLIFTGLYVLFGRLPQAIFQSAFFGRKLIGHIKGENKEATQKAVENIRESICKNYFVSFISDFAKKRTENLVEDFYDDKIENKQGYLTYEQIQANYAFEQAKNSSEFKEIAKLATNHAIITEIDKKIDLCLKQYCIPFLKSDAIRSYHILTDIEENKIKDIIKNKIYQEIGLLKEPQRKPLRFPGADFLATNIFKLLDLKTRIQKVDYTSSHHNMTTAYDNDEIRISFEYELLPVICKCIHGLRNTTNRIFNAVGQY